MKLSSKDPEIAAMEALDPSEDEHKEMIHTINSLLQDVTELQDKLAVYQMSEFNSEQKEAAETIKDLREQLRIKEIILDGVTQSRGLYMNQVAEAVRAAKYWHKRCLKA